MRFILPLILLLTVFDLFAAELQRFKGDVRVNNMRPVVGQALNSGDVLVAKGKGSFFVVRYPDGSRFMIKDGVLKVSKMERKDNRSFYDLVRGGLYLYINPETKHDFRVNTKKVSMAVRGTKFWIKETENESYLCVCDGVVETTNKKGRWLVKRKQDVRASSDNAKLELTVPNKQMWDMALKGLAEINITVD